MFKIKMTDKKQLTTEQFSNEILKEVFQELHSLVVDNINTSSVIDRLFCARVITANDMHDLDLVNHRLDKCRRLLIMLHKSKNPRAFVELRRAINDELTYDWLVSDIDEKYRLMTAAALSAHVVARVRSEPTLKQRDIEIDVSELSLVIGELREENASLTRENSKLKDDIEQLVLDKSAYEKNMVNLLNSVDDLKKKLQHVEQERDDLRCNKVDVLTVQGGMHVLPGVEGDRRPNQSPVHAEKTYACGYIFVEYDGEEVTAATGNVAPTDRDMVPATFGEQLRDAWALHINGSRTPPVLKSPKVDRKESALVGVSQHQTEPVDGQTRKNDQFIDETTKQTWSITLDEIPPSSTKLLHVIPKGNSVRALTSLGNQLFVVRWPNRQRVEVYNSLTFNLDGHLIVRGLRGIPHGMASCATNSCLYVSDGSNDSIYRVGLLNQDNDVTNWRLDGCPFGLSVNADGNLIVAIRPSGGQTSRLLEITTKGSLVREIRLPWTHIDNVFHAIQLGGGGSGRDEFLLGYNVFGDASPRLSSIVVQHKTTFNGHAEDSSIVNSFVCGRNQVAATTQLGPAAAVLNASTCFTHLALDRCGNVVMATDRENNRIIVLDRLLTEKNRISVLGDRPVTGARVLNVVLDGGLGALGALYLDKSRDHLYVGEWKGGRVFVFAVAGLSPKDLERRFV